MKIRNFYEERLKDLEGCHDGEKIVNLKQIPASAIKWY